MKEPEYEMADNLIESLIESWNDKNPKSKLNEELIDLIKTHVRYAYVAGYDKFRMQIEEMLKYTKSNDMNRTQISRYYLLSKIKSLGNGSD